jgi:hypothetical protein
MEPFDHRWATVRLAAASLRATAHSVPAGHHRPSPCAGPPRRHHAFGAILPPTLRPPLGAGGQEDRRRAPVPTGGAGRRAHGPVRGEHA